MTLAQAPAGRADPAMLARQVEEFDGFTVMRTVLDACPFPVLVLNPQRQIIFCNEVLTKLTGAAAPSVVGMRPGEVFQCAHAHETPGGCGTSETCTTCGVVLAILAALDGNSSRRECRMTVETPAGIEALDLDVFCRPMRLDHQAFVVFTLQDISHEKRRRVLERLFFHDVLNTAGVTQNLANLLTTMVPHGDAAEFVRLIGAASAELISEITGQWQLAAAENQDLQVALAPVNGLARIHEVANQYRAHLVAQGREIRLDGSSVDVLLRTDASLLTRVLGNMLRNALEAVREGETVTIGCRPREGKAEFWVHNPGVMPENVRLQVFQRSFSTKGSGRGLGTYSIRLLTERYLNGQVSFRSVEGEGTTFLARYSL